MEICIRENYIDKTCLTRINPETNELMYNREDLKKPPYNYQIVEVDDKYADCIYSDFDCKDDTFVFNLAKYNARKINADNLNKIAKLKLELIPIKEDVEQVELFGMVRDDYEEKKQRCAEIVNEIRRLMGKEPRKIENTSNRMS